MLLLIRNAIENRVGVKTIGRRSDQYLENQMREKKKPTLLYWTFYLCFWLVWGIPLFTVPEIFDFGESTILYVIGFIAMLVWAMGIAIVGFVLTKRLFPEMKGPNGQWPGWSPIWEQKE